MDSNMGSVKSYQRILTGSSEINLKSISVCLLHHTKVRLGCYLMTRGTYKTSKWWPLPRTHSQLPQICTPCSSGAGCGVFALHGQTFPKYLSTEFSSHSILWQWFHGFIDIVWRSNFVFVLNLLVLVHVLYLLYWNNQSFFTSSMPVMIFLDICHIASQAFFFQPEKS